MKKLQGLFGNFEEKQQEVIAGSSSDDNAGPWAGVRKALDAVENMELMMDKWNNECCEWEEEVMESLKKSNVCTEQH